MASKIYSLQPKEIILALILLDSQGKDAWMFPSQCLDRAAQERVIR